MIKVFRNKSRIDKIGFCNRGKDKDLEFACLILSCGRKIVSTMSYSEEDKISPGEFLQNRIDDFNYCMNLNNITTLQAEFELYDDETHSINKTCTNGYNGEHFAKVGRDDMSERDERSIGFIQGVVYAAGLIKEYQLSSEQLLKETGFSMEDLIKYGDPIDVKKLSLSNHKQKPTKPKTSELRIGK